jgi:hypothetical protein
MYRVTAQRVRGSNGRPTWGAFDLSNLYVDPAGELIDHWDREVTYQGTCTLQQLFDNDRLLRYNLLASILLNDERIDPNTEIEYYSSGSIKEIRFGKTSYKKIYRVAGQKYLGKR